MQEHEEQMTGLERIDLAVEQLEMLSTTLHEIGAQTERTDEIAAALEQAAAEMGDLIDVWTEQVGL